MMKAQNDIAFTGSSTDLSSNSSVSSFREGSMDLNDDHTTEFSSPFDYKLSKKTKGASGLPLSGDKLQRSRERNRIHARKTRQRKKEQMQVLQSRGSQLKDEQVRLKQVINEKNTASILVGLFAASGEASQPTEDPRVEELLRRTAEEIPDASKIPELPSLILPGQHASKKTKTAGNSNEALRDGIDHKLLGKDRATCTPEELDQIRRERNRMHAKRTRDRKRMFMEEMEVLCRQLEDENDLLRSHLLRIDPDADVPSTTSPLPSKHFQIIEEIGSSPSSLPNDSYRSTGVTFDQIKTLIDAAVSFEKRDHAEISDCSVTESEEQQPIAKKMRHRNISHHNATTSTTPLVGV